MTKPIFLGLVLTALISPQFTKGQTPACLTNSTSKTDALAVAMSVGPCGFSNNTYWMPPPRDFNGLKCELAGEMNKAKLDLCLSNQQAINTIREESDKKCRDLMAHVESAAQRRFYELKDVMDVEISDNKNVLTWFGILSTIVGTLATIFGVVIPFLSEKRREDDYEELKERVEKWQERQAGDYKTLTEGFTKQNEEQAAQVKKMQERMTRKIQECNGMTAVLSGDRYFHEYLNSKNISHACTAVIFWMSAVVLFVRSNSGRQLSSTIVFLHQMDVKLVKSEKQNLKTELQKKKQQWHVEPSEVKAVLDAMNSEDRLPNGNIEVFEGIYNEYGLPKT